MLFKPVFALVLLATFVSGRTLTLKELLKRALDDIADPDDVPVVAIPSMTWQSDFNLLFDIALCLDCYRF